MLNISVKTLRTLAAAGEIKSVLVGARRKFEPDDLKDFIREKKNECPSTNRQNLRTGNTTSKLGVFDFTAAREQRIRAPRNDTKTGNAGRQRRGRDGEAK